MKKFLSLTLALVLALALAVPSYAAEPEIETVGVIVDGERISFSDAAPELRSGQTMVPLKFLVEAMGGTVTPIGGTLLCAFGDKEVTVRPDSSSYYQDGCTYVPVRDLAEPLGYDVYWDSGERAAVLIDRQAIIDPDRPAVHHSQRRPDPAPADPGPRQELQDPDGLCPLRGRPGRDLR